jgi:putative ABC transport system permease protein
MGIPVVLGRGFEASDGPEGQPVVLVNEAFARRFFPGQHAIGRRVNVGSPNRPSLTIVGIIKDVKQQGIAAPTGTEIYFPMLQTPSSFDRANRTMHVVVRMRSGNPESLEPAVRRAVGEIDSTLAIAKLATMDELMYDAVAKPRFVTTLLGVLAGLALVLAAVGIYGIMSYSVAQRTHELAIRMALGAEPTRVRAMVLGQGLRLATWGIVLGVAGALVINYVLRRALTEMLFQTGAFDPATFLAVIGLMVGVAAVASYAPARRATRVTPMVALRDA